MGYKDSNWTYCYKALLTINTIDGRNRVIITWRYCTKAEHKQWKRKNEQWKVEEEEKIEYDCMRWDQGNCRDKNVRVEKEFKSRELSSSRKLPEHGIRMSRYCDHDVSMDVKELLSWAELMMTVEKWHIDATYEERRISVSWWIWGSQTGLYCRERVMNLAELIFWTIEGGGAGPC